MGTRQTKIGLSSREGEGGMIKKPMGISQIELDSGQRSDGLLKKPTCWQVNEEYWSVKKKKGCKSYEMQSCRKCSAVHGKNSDRWAQGSCDNKPMKKPSGWCYVIVYYICNQASLLELIVIMWYYIGPFISINGKIQKWPW